MELERRFRIGLVDRPSVLFRIAPLRALKTGRYSKWDQNVFICILTQRYYPHTSRESVSPVCGIFEIKVAFIALNKIPTLLCLTEGQPFLRLVVSSRCKCVELIVKVKINE